MEKVICLSCCTLRFLDTLGFLLSSHETLVNNLLHLGSDKFRAMNKNVKMEKVEKLLKKEIYPYSYMTDFYKFQEMKSSSRSAFVNDFAMGGTLD